MPRPRSINQNNMPDALPNFRNLGVVLRIVLMVNGLALFVVLTQATSMQDIGQRMLHGSAFLQPVLLSSLLLLYALNTALTRLNYRLGMAGVLLAAALVSVAIAQLGGALFSSPTEYGAFYIWSHVALSIFTTALILAYFRLRAHSLSPAFSGARLQALQARIRPHFLFNSINAVLGIVRSDPKRAESALEDMSDLFRMAMADNRELVALKREVELSRQYLALEQLRLGDRLKVDWQTQDMPQDALVPPLMLQPLLENAVYHGIEPMHDGGEITVKLYRSGKEMHLDVYNPCQAQGKNHTGNKMALANIRERLDLQFDLEASYSVDAGKDYYRVHIQIPYIKEESP
ncbi:MAG: two-component system LytT family sensor histidine kinase [Gallionellaceae bacterium]|nr:MAG: two-component system LytT family sensor histidine kinase [Gallionellaceae bacterium]